MSNYTKATNFATKDALTTGNPLKTLSGTELDDEFNAISVASATKANANNAALTGIPVAPTAAADTSTTQVATTAFVTTEANLKADLASPTFTGVPAAPTAAADTSTTQLATTAFVTTEANLKADLAGATFTGAITTTSTVDGVDIATRDAILSSTKVTADAALPKAGGTMTGNTLHGDNVKSTFGTGGDLEIYHSGSNSIINDGGTGDLLLQANAFRVQSASGADDFLIVTPSGGVDLRHNVSGTVGTKLATTSTGIDITGTVTADKLKAVNSAGTATAEVDITSGATWRLRSNPTTGTNPYGMDIVKGGAGTDVKMSIDSSGNVGITGTVTADGLELGDNEKAKFGAGGDLEIYHDGSNNYISGVSGAVFLKSSRIDLRGSNNELMFVGTENGAGTLYYDNSAKLATTSTGVDVTGTVTADGYASDTAGLSNFVAGVNAGNSIVSGGNWNTLVGDYAGTDNTTGDNNTAIGYEALKANTTASSNTALGRKALFTNTTGASNTAVGDSALLGNTTGGANSSLGVRASASNTTGSDNVSVGYKALEANTTGADNTAIGTLALNDNTTANSNTAVGKSALSLNTTGTRNIASGSYALNANTTGNNNSAFGTQSLQANTTASDNTAVGYAALNVNTTGTSNTAVGKYASLSNTVGAYNTSAGVSSLTTNTTGSYNAAVGFYALQNNTTASYNSAFGTGALRDNTIGANNTASGFEALKSNTTASSNTANGVYALTANTTGDNNTAVGYQALYSNTTGTYNIGIGRNATATSATASGQCTLGNSSITSLRCNDTSISSLSDARDKTDVIESPYGLDFINTIRPVQYLWDTRDGNVKDGTTRVGFIAQELLSACDGNNAVLDLVLEDNPEKLEAKYGNLLPIMAQAIKDLSAKNDALEARLTLLEG